MNIKFNLRHYVGDVLICLFMLVLLILGYIMFFGSKNENHMVRILRDGEEVGVYKLSESTSFDVNGVHIRIEDGIAVIESSDCPDKICIKMQGVDKDGGGAVCIPNKVVLEPYSDKRDSVIVAG